MTYSRGTIEERFHSGYMDGGCWNWQRSKDKDGYGYIKHHKKTTKAHRVSWILHYGEIPDGLWVLHKCDNPSCVNPEHLWLGTALDNSKDMVSKGRAIAPKPDMRGDRNSNATLSSADVLWIRENYTWGSCPSFAKKFGVCVEAIRKARRGESWKSI